MKLNERMSYLQGLLDGMEVNDSTKEGKALLQMAKFMQGMVGYVNELQNQIDELAELCDILDEDLGNVEEIIYDIDEDDECCCHDDDDEEYDDDDYVFDDDELYEVSCPSCNDVIIIDESMVEEGSMKCPNCGEMLEFDFDEMDISGNKDDSESDE